MSDREKAKLRGPVKTCLEDYEHAAKSITDRRSTETIYDEAGRLLSTRYIYPGFSDQVSTRSYDKAGRLSRIISGKAGELASETLYAYDEKGRIAEVRNVKAEEIPSGGGGQWPWIFPEIPQGER